MANLNLDLKNLKNLKLNLNWRTPPKWVKTLAMTLPVLIMLPLAVFLVYLPNSKQIKELNGVIDGQNAELAKSKSIEANLDQLKAQNKELIKRLDDLKKQLPAEKEVSALLEQIQDLATGANLTMNSWRPNPKKNHPSGLIYEIPQSISVTGTYHNIGKFFASITSLSRIVNISSIGFGTASSNANVTMLAVSFTASTYTLVSEEVLTK